MSLSNRTVAERTSALPLPASVRDRARLSVVDIARRQVYPLLVGLVVLLVVAADVGWRLEETRPPHFDMGGHLWKSLNFYDFLVHFDLAHFFGGYFYYPPFTYWVADVFYLVLGSAMWVAVLSNSVFVAILAFSTYGLGQVLWSKRVGFLAAAFALASPMLVTQFKEYQVDAPLTAMVALGLYSLVRANAFENRRWSLLFGLASGLGLLTKWTFPLPIALPVTVAVCVALAVVVRARAWARLANLALAGLVAGVVAGPWYVHNWSVLRADIRQNTLNPDIYRQYGDPAVGSLKANLWYFWKLIDPQLYVPLLVFLVVGLGVALWRREALRRNLYPLALVASTYVCFSLLHHKDARYTLPMMAGVAVVATYWIEYLPRRARQVVATALVTICAVMFLVVSFGTSLLPKQIVIETPLQHVALFAQRGYIIGPPTDENWRQEQIIRYIARIAPGATVRYEGPSTIWFNTEGNLYYMLRNGLYEVWDRRQAKIFLMRRRHFARVPPGFIEVRSGLHQVGDRRHAKTLRLRRRRATSLPRGFVAVRRYHLPDRTTVTVGRRVSAPPQGG